MTSTPGRTNPVYSYRTPWPGIVFPLAIVFGGTLMIIWRLPIFVTLRIILSAVTLVVAIAYAISLRHAYGLEIYEGRIVVIHKKRRTPYNSDELVIRWKQRPENSGDYLMTKNGDELYYLAHDEQLVAEVRKQVSVEEKGPQ